MTKNDSSIAKTRSHVTSEIPVLLALCRTVEYFGVAIPVGQGSGRTMLASAKFSNSELIIDNPDFIKKNRKLIEAMAGSLAVSFLNRPDMKSKVSPAEPAVFPPFRIKLDRSGGTFTAFYDGTDGKRHLKGRLGYSSEAQSATGTTGVLKKLP